VPTAVLAEARNVQSCPGKRKIETERERESEGRKRWREPTYWGNCWKFGAARAFARLYVICFTGSRVYACLVCLYLDGSIFFMSVLWCIKSQLENQLRYGYVGRFGRSVAGVRHWLKQTWPINLVKIYLLNFMSKLKLVLFFC